MQHHLTGQRSSRGDRHPCHTQWTFSLEVVCTFALQGVAGGSGDGVSHAGFVTQVHAGSADDGVHGHFGDVGFVHVHLETGHGDKRGHTCQTPSWSRFL